MKNPLNFQHPTDTGMWLGKGVLSLQQNWVGGYLGFSNSLFYLSLLSPSL